MKLSILDINIDILRKKQLVVQIIEENTRFGNNGGFGGGIEHPVLDECWNITQFINSLKSLAAQQIGSSGSGNHFVDIGLVTLDEHKVLEESSLIMKSGTYVAIMSHSGSRGTGFKIASHYNSIARNNLHPKHKMFHDLSWLNLDTQAGQEYWLAMELMGRYAKANHEIIHKKIINALGCGVIWSVENHHNFAWKEQIDGKEVIVHRKGATPAQHGVYGIIPGSMASPAYVVMGKGNESSINSASHGAGRTMSRKKAREKFNWNAVKGDLDKKGITVISAGLDECPSAYKNIERVIEAQGDLIEIVAKFEPKFVKMDN